MRIESENKLTQDLTGLIQVLTNAAEAYQKTFLQQNSSRVCNCTGRVFTDFFEYDIKKNDFLNEGAARM